MAKVLDPNCIQNDSCRVRTTMRRLRDRGDERKCLRCGEWIGYAAPQSKRCKRCQGELERANKLSYQRRLRMRRQKMRQEIVVRVNVKGLALAKCSKCSSDAVETHQRGYSTFVCRNTKCMNEWVR